MQRKTWIIAVTIVVLAGALAGGLYWRWANSPRYALQQAALALQARDMDKFFNYVNLKEILDNFVEACGKDTESPKDQSADDWSKLCRQMGQQVRPCLIAKIIYGLRDPDTGGSGTLSAPPELIRKSWRSPRPPPWPGLTLRAMKPG